MLLDLVDKVAAALGRERASASAGAEHGEMQIHMGADHGGMHIPTGADEAPPPAPAPALSPMATESGAPAPDAAAGADPGPAPRGPPLSKVQRAGSMMRLKPLLSRAVERLDVAARSWSSRSLSINPRAPPGQAPGGGGGGSGEAGDGVGGGGGADSSTDSEVDGGGGGGAPTTPGAAPDAPTSGMAAAVARARRRVRGGGEPAPALARPPRSDRSPIADNWTWPPVDAYLWPAAGGGEEGGSARASGAAGDARAAAQPLACDVLAPEAGRLTCMAVNDEMCAARFGPCGVFVPASIVCVGGRGRHTVRVWCCYGALGILKHTGAWRSIAAGVDDGSLVFWNVRLVRCSRAMLVGARLMRGTPPARARAWACSAL